jgi:hypothetical protein
MLTRRIRPLYTSQVGDNELTNIKSIYQLLGRPYLTAYRRRDYRTADGNPHQDGHGPPTVPLLRNRSL